jgi:branched-chain amino acid aminotransferase
METVAAPYVPVNRAYQTRLGEVDWDNLETGRYVSDHMLVCDYTGGKWQQAEIVPYGPFSLPPTSLVFHYGQTIFEGMKAFRTADGRVQIFRPDKHYERLLKTAERLCMPVVAPGLFREGLRRLVELERSWVPSQDGGALYLRPFQIATDTRLAVKVSESYRFAVVCSPTGSYFSRPVRVKVERNFVRAAKGGTGYAKCGGNYGGALYPTELAKQEGYDQVLWTDGQDHEYIEESGMMNVFFVIGDVLVTPPLTDSILDGVTRDSLLVLAREAGMRVEERPVSVKELEEGLERGLVKEAFGAGTAAVVSPIRVIGIDGRDHALAAAGERGSHAYTLKHALDGIRYGRATDVHEWNYFV